MQQLNETLQNIFDRRSIRQYKNRDVDPALVEILLDAANQAPSAHNQQSWRFIVVQGDKKQELAKLVSSRAKEFPKPSSSILRMAAKSIGNSSVVIGVVNTGELIRHGTELFNIAPEQSQDFFRTMEIQSSAAAVQNLLLAAQSLDLGAVWLGVLFLIKDEVLKFLGEEQGEFMAVVPVGHPLKEGSSPSKKNLDYLTKFLG